MYTKVCLKMMALTVIAVILALTSGVSAWAAHRAESGSHRHKEDRRDFQGQRRMAALLDLTARNGESSTSTFGLQQALSVAGIPYIVTDSVSAATAYGLIYSSSYISGSTLTDSERAALTTYVARGGVLVAVGVSDPLMFPLFGVSGAIKVDTRHAMTWQTATADPSLQYFDDPNEITISLGRASYAAVISSRGYTLGSAVALARYEDNAAAVTLNEYERGKAYAIGLSYTDVIVRNQLNMDFYAERTYSNGFEPTSDTIMLFLRGVYQKHVRHAVWKHTSPAASRAALMITHDVDSQSSMDKMYLFANLEKQRGMVATYNITTHYFNDGWDRDFYTPNLSAMQYLVSQGQAVASHSVGHFPDWGKTSVFPMGEAGNVPATYRPAYHGTATIGGTVYGELEVSRYLLETDLGVKVKTFRSGYLYWNARQINVMDALGYRYDSSMSANDVLTNFPYLSKYDRKLNGEVSDVYEIPMTISDSGITETNYPEKVAIWLDVIRRNAANSAPTVLLIHPNRDFKVTAEEQMLNQLPKDIAIVDMDSFGEYWRERERLEFETSLVGKETLVITISDDTAFPLDSRASLYVENGRLIRRIMVQKANGTTLTFKSAITKGSDLIIYGLSLPVSPTHRR